MVRIRNPWGSEDFKGKWSDGSSEWTEKFKSEVEYENNKKDGIFFMEINDYKMQVEETYHNFDVSDWHSAYFLKLNDDTQPLETPVFDDWICGNDCTTHTLTIKSSVAQDVWITAHQVDQRAIPKVCLNLTETSKSSAIQF